jgi:hypothetical protein
MKSARIGAIALAAMAALAPAAQADVSSTASLTNLTIWVFDLNPLDGVDPSYTIVGGPDSSTYAYIQWTAPGIPTAAQASFSSSVNDGSASSTGSFSDGSSAVGRAVACQRHVVFGAAQAQASGAKLVSAMNLGSFMLSAQSASTGGNTYGQAYTSLSIEISAGTLLVVSGDVSVASLASAGSSNEWTYGYGQIGFSSYSDGSQVGSYGYLQTYTGSNYSNLAPSAQQTIAGSVGNFGADVMALNMQAYAYTNAQAPIPEPGTYALMALGLGLVGWAKRRQR